MASSYSPLKFELITTGEQSGTWGTTTNLNIGTAIGEAITGSADVTFVSANVTLTLTDTNGSQTARNLRLRLTGTTGGARDLIVPNIEKQYIVQNDTANTVTIKNSTGTGVAIPTGMSAIVFNDGVNITSAGTYSTSLVTPLLAATDAAFVNPLPVTSGGTGVTTATGTGAVVRATSPTLVTPALGTPSAVVLTSATGLPVSTGISGLGTGVATFLATPSSANLAAAVTGETGSGALVFATSPTLVTPALGTPASGVLTNCTGTATGLTAGNATTATNQSGGTVAATTGSFSGAITSTVGGSAISLTNATSNWLLWGTGGVAAPAFTTRSAGTKVVLYPNVTASAVDYAIGVETGALWNSVAQTTNSFKWYGGTTLAASLSGTGNLLVTGTVAGDNITAGGNVTGNAATVTNGVYTTNFTGANQSTGASGFQKFPGGLIMQWGSVTVSSYDYSAVTYPTAFITATRNIQFTIQAGNLGNTEGALTASSITKTGFSIFTSMSSSFPVYWLAIGY